jgi:hypothetical protein
MPSKDRVPVAVDSVSVTIASGQTESGAVDLHGMNLVGIMMPAAFTGTSVTFKGSLDGVTYNDLYNTDGTALSVTVAADRFILIVPSDFAAVRYLKLVSGSSEGAERTITLACRML